MKRESAFIHPQLPTRPRHCLRIEVREPGFENELPTHPTQFAVEPEEALEPPPGLSAAPLGLTSYLGRIEELDGDEAVVTLWERPSGLEASATLRRDDFQGLTPRVGAVIKLWTWFEAPAGGGEPIPQLAAQVQERSVSDQGRPKIREFLQSLSDDEARKESP